MKVCYDGHDEIVFDDSAYRAECPLCKEIKSREELEERITELETEVETLKEEVSSLEGDG